MAVITGRYGAVQVSLPDEAYDDGVSYSSIWKGSTHIVTDSNSGIATKYEIPNSIATNYVDSHAHSGNNKHELWIPQGNDLVGQTPKIVSSITSWSLDNTINPIEYTASNTHGYRGRLAGLHDATGNIAGLGAIPPLAPGQRFRFYGFTGPANGAVDSTKGLVYSITAIVNSVQIQVSYQWNSPITWTVGWQSDWHQAGDELDVTDAEGFWDYTKIPCCELMPSTTKNLQIEGAEDLCLLDANIQFTNETAQYANSCSAEAGGWQSRLAGPTTCSVSTNIQGDDFRKTGSLLPGTNHRVKIFVGSDTCDTITCWDFNALFFSGFSGLNVDVTNNSPLQFSCNMDFNAFPDCDPGFIRFNRSIGKSHYDSPDDAPGWEYLVNLDPSASSNSIVPSNTP